MNGLTRGQLAQRAQVHMETVRFYEQAGLLSKAPRTAAGYRKFPEEAVDRLMFVKRAQGLGFSLREIRELLLVQDGHTDTCAEVRDLLRKKLSLIRDKKAELEKLEVHLQSALRKCNRVLKQQGEHAEGCPVLEQMTAEEGDA